MEKDLGPYERTFHPHAEVIVAQRPTSLRELTGGAKKEGDPTSLLDAHVSLFASREGNSSKIEYSAFVKAPMDSDKLFAFLTDLAPHKDRWFTKGAAISDWSLLDERFSEDEDLQKLLEQHQALGESWDIFAKYAKTAFVPTLRNDVDRMVVKAASVVVVDPNPLTFLSERWQQWTGSDRMEFKGTIETLTTEVKSDNVYIGEHNIDMFRKLEGMEKRFNYSEDIELSLDKFCRKYKMDQTLPWLHSFLLGLDTKTRRTILANGFAPYGINPRMVLFSDDPIGVDIHNENNVKVTHTGDKNVEIIFDDCYKGQLSLRNTEPKKIYYNVDKIQTSNFMFPLIQWSSDGRDRAFSFDSWSERSTNHALGDIYKAVPVPEGLQFHPDRINPLLGYLTVSSLTPHKWKEKMPLPHDPETLQDMNSAQVVVEALFHQKKIAQSPILSSAESHLWKTGKVVNK